MSLAGVSRFVIHPWTSTASAPVTPILIPCPKRTMILVVCKSVARCAALLDAIKGTGKVLITVTSANNAISYLWVAHFDWLLTEVTIDLPHDGLDLADYAAQISPHTKVVLIFDQDADDISAVERGTYPMLCESLSAPEINKILQLIEESERA